MENRRNVMIAMGAAFAAGAAPLRGASVPNDVRGFPDAEEIKHPFGVQHIHFRGETDQLKVLEAGSLLLNAGQTPHPPHKHPEEELMVVAEGSCEISIEGKITKCEAGATMYCAAEHLHDIVNTGDKPMLFYYTKWLTRG